MASALVLNGRELVIEDGGGRLLAVYPHRDADYTKLTLETTGLLLLSCGASGIGSKMLQRVGKAAVGCLERFCEP